MKEIILTKGKVALVDDEDFDELNKYNWYASKSSNSGIFYAKRYFKKKNGKQINIPMHRQIFCFPKKDIDHINHNGLDNRKCNLRLCNQSQNSMNKKRHRNNKSGFRGVSWNKHKKKWVAQVGNGSRFVGYFDSKEEAGHAYDRKAKEIFGEFAILNFQEE